MTTPKTEREELLEFCNAYILLAPVTTHRCVGFEWGVELESCGKKIVGSVVRRRGDGLRYGMCLPCFDRFVGKEW